MPTFTDDSACAQAINAGSRDQWQRLLDSLSETILSVAVQWCTPACARGTCPLLRRRGPLRDRLAEDDCDAVLACYLYIAEKHLPGFVRDFPGGGSLTSWCSRSLRGLASDPYRRIDFLRTGHTCAGESCMSLRVPRARTPLCLQNAPIEVRQLYRQVCLGRTVADIAADTAESEETVQTRVDDLLSLLAERDWDAYIEALNRHRLKLHPMIGAFAREDDDDADSALIEPAAGGPSVEDRWRLRQVIAVFARWMRMQSATDCLLLRLYLYEGKSAGDILARLAGRSDAPKTERHVYSRIETLINRMRTTMPSLLEQVEPIKTDRKTFVDVIPYMFALIEERSCAYRATPAA